MSRIEIAMLGDSGCGKSALVNRISKNEFNLHNPCTLGTDCTFPEVDATEGARRKIKLRVIDTAGQEQLAQLANAYYRSAQGFVLCFDLCNKATFLRLDFWLSKIKEHRTTLPELILVGCKKDLVKEATICKAEIDAWLEGNKVLKYIETSAKDNVGITEAFAALATKIDSVLEKSKPQPPKSEPIAVTSLQVAAPKKSSGGCC